MSHKVVFIEKGKRVEEPKQPAGAQNTEFMLGWCRQWIKSNGVPIFAQMEAAVRASRSGTLVAPQSEK